VGTDTFQTLWFSGLVLGMSGYALFKGGQILWKREIDNPFVSLKGGRALALGAAVAALGLAGIAMALFEGMKLRR
jgi:hypothetical protein